MLKNETIDITEVLTHIIYEIIKHTKIFHNININKLLVCISSNRNSGRGGGIFGKLVPMRFEEGSAIKKFKGRYYSMPEIVHNKEKILYLIYFYMPRFFDLEPMEKLNVIFHELFHISPDFNGDIRRVSKHKAAHGHCKKHFDSQYSQELESFYEYIKETSYMKFLALDSKKIHETFGKVTGRRLKVPKPVLVEKKLRN